MASIAQVLTAPQDTNGQSYPAMRPAFVHQVNLAAGVAQGMALLPQTKVLRVCNVADVYVHIGPSGTATQAGDPLVAAAHYQDFTVYPGDVLSVICPLGGWCSVIEFA
jgi:hypothetical protein